LDHEEFFILIGVEVNQMHKKEEKDDKKLKAEIIEVLKSMKKVVGALHQIFLKARSPSGQPIYHEGFDKIGKACCDLEAFPTTSICSDRLAIALRALEEVSTQASSVKAPYKPWEDCESVADIVSYVAYYLESVVRSLLSLVSQDKPSDRSNYFFKGPSNTEQLKQVEASLEELNTCVETLQQQNKDLSSLGAS
jgi:hypothetical protein